MKSLSRIIIFLFILIITACSNLLCSEANESAIKHIDSISAVQFHNDEIINIKTSESLLQSANRIDSIFSNNKKDDNSSDNGINKLIISQTEQYTNSLAYIYNQSYLRNKTKVNFINLLSEIRPNAP